MLTGYLHPGYAESLQDFGTPRELPQCGGWILERQIPGFPYRDAMGCYPLFACRDWSQLQADLENLGKELVTLSLVADPFGAFDLADLQQYFDMVTPFKEHFVIDLRQNVNDMVSKHHRYYTQKALSKVTIERCPDPLKYLDEWVDLYATLIDRHNINGIRAFSRQAFAKQLSLPGMFMFRAVAESITVGLNLWYVHGEVAYDHLTAYNSTGYKLMASYGLKWHSIQYFVDKVCWINLGGGAGIGSKATDGLSQFKMGWSTKTRPVYFCGRILDYERYAKVVQAKGCTHANYFPAYRVGEFG